MLRVWLVLGALAGVLLIVLLLDQYKKFIRRDAKGSGNLLNIGPVGREDFTTQPVGNR